MKEVKSRDQIPNYLVQSGLTGTGAEIGVWEAEYSEQILLQSNLSLLYSIDAWMLWPDHLYPDCANVSQQRYDQAMQKATMVLHKFGERSRMIKETSNRASRMFGDGQLDFVYIDANHRYPHVMEDLSSWYPKVKAGGVLAGHDYLHGIYDIAGDHVYIEVKPAVDDFIKSVGGELAITEDIWPTWMLIKGGGE